MKELSPDQRQRLKTVFEKLSTPPDSFYFQAREKTTTQNKGLSERRLGRISLMMPYQYWYHRFGETTHDKYPGYMDPTATIGLEKEHPDNAELNYFEEGPEELPDPRISQSMWLRIDEERIVSFERFADRIILEWQNTQQQRQE